MKRLTLALFAAVALFATSALAAVSYAEIQYNAPQTRVHVHPGLNTKGVVKIAVPADAKACAVGSVAVYEHDDGTGLPAYPNQHFAINISANPEATFSNYGFSEKDIYIQIAGPDCNFAAKHPGSVTPITLKPGTAYYVIIDGKVGGGKQGQSLFSFGVELRRPQ